MLNTDIQEKLQEINFPVEVQGIDGIPINMGKKVIRTDTNQVLGLVKSRYKPINHYSAFYGSLKEMQASGINFNNANFKINSYENGAFAKMEISFPEHTAFVGDHKLLLKYIARNSYNGRWKFQAFFGWLNSVCFNTLVSGKQLAYTSNRHSLNYNIEQSISKIKNSVLAVTNEVESYRHWWDKRITLEDAKKLFTNTIVKGKLTDVQKASGFSETNKKHLYILLGLFREEAKQIYYKGEYTKPDIDINGSLWCAYQSATAWSTHLNDITKETTKRHIVENQRQNIVKQMINSESWKKLEVA